jgi:HK97 family phage major capsid protein
MDKDQKQALRDINTGLDANLLAGNRNTKKVVESIESLKTREQRIAELQQRARDMLQRHGIEPRATREPMGVPKIDSYFRDLLVSAAKNGKDDEARARLERDLRDPTARLGRHYRAISTGLTAGGTFAEVQGPPNYIIDAFASGAATESVLASLLPSWPMPEHGIHVSTPQVTTPSAAGSVAENTAVTTTDPVTALIDTPKATIAGHVTASVQLLDFGGLPTELFLAQELGASNAGEFERQVAVGSGTNELTGLFNTGAIVTQVYTDATPTGAEWLQSLAQLISAQAQARKRLPDAIAVSARRWAWLLGQLDSSLRPIFHNVEPPIRTNGSTIGLVGSIGGIAVYATAGIPSNLGAGTNEDRPLVLYTPDLWLLASPIQLIVTSGQSSGFGSLSEQVVAWGYAALLVRHANAIGTLTGTGNILPAGY